MKKALTAAAVAVAFAAPSAMAAEGPSINVYVPLAVMIGDAENTTASTTQDRETLKTGGGSRLMFNWTDTLDNGMTYNAYWSMNWFNFDEAGALGSRNSHVGLAGDFGSIKLGTNEQSDKAHTQSARNTFFQFTLQELRQALLDPADGFLIDRDVSALQSLGFDHWKGAEPVVWCVPKAAVLLGLLEEIEAVANAGYAKEGEEGRIELVFDWRPALGSCAGMLTE